MRTYISLFIISLLVLASFVVPVLVTAQTTQTNNIQPTFRICPFENLMLKTGSSGNEVKALQSVLKQDSSLYPQGIVSGYYGGLTAEAVKRVQQLNNLPQTGVVDGDTRELIFPCVVIRVTSPNGGEEWKVGETHKITWEIESLDLSQPAGVMRPLFPHLSIDLVRVSSQEIPQLPRMSQVVIEPNRGDLVFHIGGASIYGDTSFKWTIPQSIPEARNYRVRISMGKYVPQPLPCQPTPGYDIGIPCPFDHQAFPQYWEGYIWDESDSDFVILGGSKVSPTPTLTPIPTPTSTSIPDLPRLKQVQSQLTQIMELLQRVIKLLEGILAR